MGHDRVEAASRLQETSINIVQYATKTLLGAWRLMGVFGGEMLRWQGSCHPHPHCDVKSR